MSQFRVCFSSAILKMCHNILCFSPNLLLQNSDVEFSDHNSTDSSFEESKKTDSSDPKIYSDG